MEAIKRINRRGAPFAAFALLLAFGAYAHLMAIARLDMTEGSLAGVDARGEGRIRFIGYVDAHPWVAILFAALFAGSLAWLQIRKLPRWSMWLAFVLLALPVLGYAWVCLRAGSAPLIWRR